MSFGKQVLGWSRRVYKIRDEVFREAIMQLVDEMQALVPVDTGFLRASLDISKTGTPRMEFDNPSRSTFQSWDRGRILAVVESSVYGEKLYLGYTARYAAFVHYGVGDRPPRPWVDMVAQRWRIIVQEAARRVRGTDA